MRLILQRSISIGWEETCGVAACKPPGGASHAPIPVERQRKLDVLAPRWKSDVRNFRRPDNAPAARRTRCCCDALTSPMRSGDVTG